jgi:hypothetical protein
MFFEEHQKLIFSPQGSTEKFDPLALDRLLRKESNNSLGRLIDAWKAPDLDEGDISDTGRLATVLRSDEAEVELARISRIAFNLKDFPECTDAVALEYLCQYLDWCKKKGMKDTISPDSSTSETGSNPIPMVKPGTPTRYK